MIYLFLADGFEECEALVPLDILRRAGLSVKTVGVTGKTVTGAHGIEVTADILAKKVSKNDIEAVILPGGMPGTLNLEKDKYVNAAVDFAAESGALICAICAAPSILGHKGLLKGKKATCYPGYEKELEGAEFSDAPVIVDGNVITSFGPGGAYEFGFAILEALSGKDTAEDIKTKMKYI